MGHAIAIVTDSTSDIPVEIVAERNIHIVAQHIIWGTESYLDGIELPVDQFYGRLATDNVLPKTSQASVADFVNGYQKAREADNAESVVCITLSADLSGTYNSAIQAAAQVDFPVQVIDARIASMPLGFVVMEAADARDAGGSLDDIVQAVRAAVPNVQIYFTVANLEFLHRSGRVSAAKRLFGDALKIKPLLYVNEGTIEAKESVRTRRRVIRRILDITAQDAENREFKRLGVIHGAALDDAEALRQTLQSQFNHNKIYLNSCCSAIGVHVGPGVIGIAYQLA